MSKEKENIFKRWIGEIDKAADEMVMPEGGPDEVYDGAAVPGYADEAETESEKPED